jgi:haloalkane dehalogenase
MNQFDKNPEISISSDFAFQMKKIHIDDIDMSYYEQGEGEVVLFLHGIPTSSYVWRNIVSRVGKHQRAIALDLM